MLPSNYPEMESIMSNGLILPFAGSAFSNSSVFMVTQGDPGPPATGQGGIAIAGFSYGTDQGLPSNGVLGVSDVGNGISGYSGQGTGIVGTSQQGSGVIGLANGTSEPGHGPTGVIGRTNSGSDSGVWGDNVGSGSGVAGSSAQGTGVIGEGFWNGVQGTSPNTDASGVWGENTGGGVGVGGETNSARADQGAGVWGNSTGFAYGVKGTSNEGDGVGGFTASSGGAGVLGANADNSAFGSLGSFLQSVPPQPPIGVFGANWNQQGYAGFFAGNVWVIGTIWKSFSFFRIDHPLDPANKWLNHSAVEAAEMKNIYDGIVVLDANGQANVQLPTWFEALNYEFRYQLTALGAPAPTLHVAAEISNNRFRIAGGSPASRVCWQITGVRRDADARAQPLQVEEEKAASERGRYLHPVRHGMPAERELHREMRDKFEQRVADSRSARS
jgi:hypothetical protein